MNVFKFLIKYLTYLYILKFVMSTSRISVSVILPTYNGAKYLDNSINCILNQTLKEIELIIVNDASNDNTLEILNKYKNNKNVKIINLKKNKGQGNARNLGIEIALGEFIGFMDDDDYVDNRFYEMLYYYSKDKDIVVGTFLDCIYNYKYCTYNEEQNYYDSTIYDKDNYKKKRVYGFIYNSLWRKNFIVNNKIKFPLSKYLEDREFRIQCYKNNPRLFKIPDNGIYYYYERRKGSSNKNNSSKYFDRIIKKSDKNKLKNMGIKNDIL